MRLDFRDSNPEVIDLSPEGGVVSTLRESKIECLASDKVRFPCAFHHPGQVLTMNPERRAGCVPLLLPFAISRSFAGLPFVY